MVDLLVVRKGGIDTAVNAAIAAQKGAGNGIAPLDADSKVLAANVRFGAVVDTVAQGNDARLRTIRDEGTTLTNRSILDFTGPGVTVQDDSVAGRTKVDIPGASASGAAVIESVADLRALTAASPFTVVRLIGWNSGSVEGGGILRLDTSDTVSADDSGTVFVDASGRRWKRSLDFGASLTPAMFGARYGMDATTQTQAMINKVRTSWNAANSAFRYVADLAGQMWQVSSIDLTVVRQPGMRIQNGGLYGVGLGQNVLDLTGSNRMFLENLKIYGSKANPPAIGILLGLARDVNGNFPPAPQHNLDNVFTDGFFSKAAVLNFASEVVNMAGCEIINRHRSTTAYCLIIAGHASALDTYVGGISSAYQTVPVAADGLRSNIVHNLGQLIAERIADVNMPIIGITKANPAVVSVDPTALANAGLVNGNRVFFADVGGMTQLNKNNYAIAGLNAAAGTFQLSGVDSTAFGTFVSGSVQNMTGPAILLSGCTGVKMDSSYLLTYGTPSVVIDTRFGMVPSQIDLTFKAENQPPDIVRCDIPDTGTGTIRDLRLNLLSVSSRLSAIGPQGAGSLRIEGADIKITDMPSTPPASGVFRTRTQIALLDARIRTPFASTLTPALAAQFVPISGTVFAADTNTTDRYGTVTQR